MGNRKKNNGIYRKVSVSEVIVNDRAREDFGDIDSLVESIEDKGLLQPIVLSKDMKLLAGGRRFKAINILKWKRVPAILIDSDDIINDKEIELLENLVRKDFTWQEQVLLIKDIHDLYAETSDTWSMRATAKNIDKSIGLVSESLKIARAIDLIPEIKLEKSLKDAMKSLQSIERSALTQEIAKRVDKGVKVDISIKEEINSLRLEFLNEASKSYKIGDCLEYMESMEDGWLGNDAICEVDPPYGVNLKSTMNRNKDIKSYVEVLEKEYKEFLTSLCTNLYKSCGDRSTVIFWFASTRYNEVRRALESSGFRLDSNPGIWNKINSPGHTNRPMLFLGRNYEPFFIARKGKWTLGKPGSSNVFNYKNIQQDKIHPAERPVKLIQDIITTVTPIRINSTIFIPFMGSGNTWRAVKGLKLDVKCFGFDLAEEFRNSFLARIAKGEN